jgi:hypothetical protein
MNSNNYDWKIMETKFDLKTIEANKNTINPNEIINLIKRLPESEHHIFEYGGVNYVTTEWLVGNFCGRSFSGDTFESAAKKMIDYLYRHINHDSLVGKIVTQSGFPDLKKVEDFCAQSDEE